MKPLHTLKFLSMPFLIALLLFGLASCVEWVSLNTDDPQEIVISAVLTDSDEQVVDLFWTKRNDDSKESEYKRIREGSVELFINKNNNWELVGGFSCRSDGAWVMNYKAEYDASYRLVVSAGSQKAYAETTMPGDIKCVFWPNPTFLASTSLVPAVRPSRRIVRTDGQERDILCIAYFMQNGKIWDKITTSHTDIDMFNVLGECGSYKKNLLPADFTEEDFIIRDGIKYVEYIYDNQYTLVPEYSFNSYAFIHQRVGNTNPYKFNGYSVLFSLSDEYDEPMRYMDYPQYGMYVNKEEEYMLWGPAFDFRKVGDDLGDYDLHLIYPSQELYDHLKDVIIRIGESTEKDFSLILRRESPYSNVVGGRGIFAAAKYEHEYHENYLNYLVEKYEELRQTL